jgi:hypothetical protein
MNDDFENKDEKVKMISILEELIKFFVEEDGIVGILVGFPNSLEIRYFVFEKL